MTHITFAASDRDECPADPAGAHSVPLDSTRLAVQLVRVLIDYSIRRSSGFACLLGLTLVGSSVGLSAAGADAIGSFLCQLQDSDLVEIRSTCYDLVIIDYSSDGGETGGVHRRRHCATR